MRYLSCYLCIFVTEFFEWSQLFKKSKEHHCTRAFAKRIDLMGVILPKPILSKVVDRVGSDKVAAACCSINGYRNSMEDAHVLNTGPDRMMFGVFDGHSNDKCSNYIAEHLPRKILGAQGPLTDQVLQNLCISCDEQFLEDVGEGGTTATFAIVEPGQEAKSYALTICNIGDSRVLVARNGTLLFATEDHKPQNPEERARIESCGGTVRMNRVDGDLAVSRAFGDFVFKRFHDDLRKQKVIAVPDVTRMTVQEGDVLIIACDGVFEGSFSNDEVVQFVFSQLPPPGGDLAVVAARVCDQAVRRGSKDNISCLLVQFADGTAMVNEHGAASFVPGPPYPKTHESSRLAYSRMAMLAQVSLADALQQRYELFLAYTRNQLSSLSPLKQVAFEMSDDVDVETERGFFGAGPPPGSEKAFFAAMAEGNR